MRAFSPKKRPLLILAALCGAFTFPACAVISNDDFSNYVEGTSAGTSGAASGGSGGGPQQDGSIEIGPTTDPSGSVYDYQDLCGEGPCEVGGDGTECSGGGMGGGASAEPSCKLVPAAGVAVAQCDSTGGFEAGEPCKSAKDCAAGLGCAATPNGGVCRSYCCGDVEQCPASTYCHPQPMAENTLNMQPALIPVCIPASKCELLNDTMTCPEGLTCSIVRADGTTSCIEPGDGELNASCPCAAGYVCSKLKDQCKKLCHIGQDAIDCGGGATCQGGSMNYPKGIGICVGGSN